MGQFSWLDCKTKEQILDDRVRNVYVLVPEEFKSKYGDRIEEPCYDGYGNFGGYDIYELIALWNRKYISLYNIRDIKVRDYCRNDFSYYFNGIKRQVETLNRIMDFINDTDNEVMVKRYGDDYLRMIGIDIACYDEQQDELMYPIKITYNKNAKYENCDYSLSDPNQGWDVNEYNYDEDCDREW